MSIITELRVWRLQNIIIIIVIIIVIIVDGEYRVYDTQLTKFPGIFLADNVTSLKEYITLRKLWDFYCMG
jgi:hypothetical protein